LECNSRKHLIRLASKAMHQILVDYARKKLMRNVAMAL